MRLPSMRAPVARTVRRPPSNVESSTARPCVESPVVEAAPLVYSRSPCRMAAAAKWALPLLPVAESALILMPIQLKVVGHGNVGASKQVTSPALESSHAVAWVVKEAASLAGKLVLVNLSGRGDKDLGILTSSGNDPDR